MRDRGLIAYIDIVLNVQRAELAIAHRKMYCPQNVFVDLAGLEVQSMLFYIG